MSLCILFPENATSLWAIFTPPNFSIDTQTGIYFARVLWVESRDRNSAPNCSLESVIRRKQRDQKQAEHGTDWSEIWLQDPTFCSVSLAGLPSPANISLTLLSAPLLGCEIEPAFHLSRCWAVLMFLCTRPVGKTEQCPKEASCFWNHLLLLLGLVFSWDT